MEADGPPLHDDHIERSIDDGGSFDSIPLPRVETLVKDRDGNGTLGTRLVDSEERVQDLGTERDVVGSWLTPPLKKGVMRMVICDSDQLRMGEIEIVEGK